MADIQKIVEELSKLTVQEAVELSKALEETWGVSAAAAVAVATDSLAVTKVLAKFADEHKNLTIVGGKMDAELLDVNGVVQLSKLPSLLEIRGTIARILIEPASRLARVSAEYGKKQD